MAVIIFDGIDKAGKTTLINNVYNEINTLFKSAYVYHPTRPFKPYVDYANYIKGEYIAMYELSKFFKKDYLIFDRFIASEYAYSQLDRGQKIVKDLTYITDIDKKIKNDAIMIYVKANSDIIKKRIVNEKEITEDDINALLCAYDDYLDITQIPYITIDTTKEEISISTNKIISFLKSRSIL